MGFAISLPLMRADAHAAQHVLERDVGDGQRGAGADNGERAGIALRIGRQHHADHLRLVHEAFGEQRADGPVDQAAGEDFFFGGTSLALDEAARKLAGGVSVFAVIDGEREECRSRFGFLAGAGGHQHHGVPGADDHGAIGLLCNFACFKGDLSTIQVDFNCM